jgi:hypothetical protein
VTTILEDFKTSSNCAGDVICTVFDIFGIKSPGWLLVLGSGDVVDVRNTVERETFRKLPSSGG